MEFNLKDKVIVITGGASGIGKSVAKEFGREGAKIAVCDRVASKLEALNDEFSALDIPLFTGFADVAKTPELERFAKAVMEHYGTINVWINNAGINLPRKHFMDVSEEEWHDLVDIDVKGVFYGAKIAAECMAPAGGVIINTASLTARIPTAGIALYSAAKAAVQSLTQTMAAELACHNIRVVAILPGYTQTELTAENIRKNFDSLVSAIPVRRLATPEDMAAAYVFLASDAAGYINGVSLEVSGAKLCTQNPQWAWTWTR